MAGRTVTDPTNLRWTVRRRWAHWRLEWRGPRDGHRSLDVFNGADLLGGADDLPIVGVIVVVVLAVVFTIGALVFVLPALLFVVEVLILVLAAGLAVLGRVLFRRPWTVEARSSSGERREWKVVGWRASGALVDQVAHHLSATGRADTVAVEP